MSGDNGKTPVEGPEGRITKTPGGSITELSSLDEIEVVGSFSDYDLDPTVVEKIADIGWKAPTPVQSLCLPHTLQGKDVAGFAQTGTGKTGVFLITAAHKILSNEERRYPGCIVLSPTRELAVQIQQDAEALYGKLNLKTLAVFGGIDYAKQAKHLREGVDCVVATPGRLKDYHQKKIIDLSNVQLFVCDEADRMFDMGFRDDVEYFLEKLSEDCQKLLFSATTNDQVKELAFEYLENPEYISVTPETLTPENITQYAIHVNSKNKLKVMIGLLKEHNPACSIIFTNTKLTAEWLHFKLAGNGIEAELITGDLPQKKRIRLIQKIKEGKMKALIATDVASRGLHISNLTHVYNFDLPDEAANYVHRIGRTARAGASGSAYSLVCEDYGQNLIEINELLGDHALETKWFDASYLEIEDKAGNPFEGRSREPRSDDGPRRAGASRDDRGDRGQREGRPRPEASKSKGRGGRDGREGGGPDRQGNNARDRNQRADQPRDGNKGRGNNKRRRDRNRKDQQDRPPQQRNQQPAPQQTAAPKDSSIGGLFKKMVRTLFGKK